MLFQSTLITSLLIETLPENTLLTHWLGIFQFSDYLSARKHFDQRIAMCRAGLLLRPVAVTVTIFARLETLP